jgi:hypothetical protein
MKNIRSSDENKNVNMQHIFINGQVSPKNHKKFKTFQNLYFKQFLSQIWYQATCDIPQDTELLLAPKVPLLISDMRRDIDDRSGSGEC